MKKLVLLIAISLLTPILISAAKLPVAPNGIAYYPNYMKWKVIAPSYREDKGHIRIITGNDVAAGW